MEEISEENLITVQTEEYYKDQCELINLRNFKERVNNLKALELFGYRIMFYKLPY